MTEELKPVRVDGDPEGYRAKFFFAVTHTCRSCDLYPEEFDRLCNSSPCSAGERPEGRNVIYIREARP